MFKNLIFIQHFLCARHYAHMLLGAFHVIPISRGPQVTMVGANLPMLLQMQKYNTVK